MDSQKMAQYFNYDAEIGDLRDKVQRQSARIRELEGALEECKRVLVRVAFDFPPQPLSGECADAIKMIDKII